MKHLHQGSTIRDCRQKLKEKTISKTEAYVFGREFLKPLKFWEQP